MRGGAGFVCRSPPARGGGAATDPSLGPLVLAAAVAVAVVVSMGDTWRHCKGVRF